MLRTHRNIREFLLRAIIAFFAYKKPNLIPVCLSFDDTYAIRIGLSIGNIVVNSKKDGIRVKSEDVVSEKHTEDELKELKRFYMESGSITITTNNDGIVVDTDDDVEGAICGTSYIVGGSINVVAGGGSVNSKNDDTSQTGIKSGYDLLIGNATITVDSADDALHANCSLYITSGTYNLASSDDGIHADSIASISNGSVTISKSYEGIEGYHVIITDGNVNVTSSDDGFNAAGGSDSSNGNSDPFVPPPHHVHSDSEEIVNPAIKIKGGTVFISAQGDGIDSNGDIYVTGGTTIVEGPSGSGNGALDKGDFGNYVACVAGGTVLALGSTGMAINFDTGNQCSGLVKLSGKQGTTISVEDGSGFTHTFQSNKSFACAVYSSTHMVKGNSYTIRAGNNSAIMNFTDSYYYSNVSGGGGGPRP